MSALRTAAAEALGTALLLAAVVGSGITGERLAGGSEALALLANSLATGAALVAILLALAPVSGAHLNPVVTLSLAWRRATPWRRVPSYLLAQFAGAILGVLVAHAMFAEPLVQVSRKAREGAAMGLGEVVATFGLVLVVLACSRWNAPSTPLAVGGYVTAAYWFTASTSFANPAVTVARTLTDTFSGIRPGDAPVFVVAQLVGAAAATLVMGWLLDPREGTRP